MRCEEYAATILYNNAIKSHKNKTKITYIHYMRWFIIYCSLSNFSL